MRIGPGGPEGDVLAGYELHVRPDGDRLILELSDRRRRAGGVPEETTRLAPRALEPRLDQMRRLVAELSGRGEVTPADREAWRAHGQVLFDLLVPTALRRLLREAAGASLWLRLRGWAVDLPWEWLDDGEGAWCDRYALGREVPVAPGPHFRPAGPVACPAHTVVLGDCAGDLPQAREEVDAVHRALRAVGLRPRTQSGEMLADDVRVFLRAADILHVAAHVDPPGDLRPGGAGIRCVDGHLLEDDRFGALRPALEASLAAARGDVAGRAIDAPPDTAIGEAWRWSWATLWGPPGTGKTWTIGRQVAAALADPDERVLVVSTTNKATDGVAREIGVAMREAGLWLEVARRVGSGADIAAFDDDGLTALLAGGEADLLRELSLLRRRHARARGAADRARLRTRTDEVRKALKGAGRAFVDPSLRVVVATAFAAVQQLTGQEIPPLLEAGRAPFTTVVLDEAGLLSSRAVSSTLDDFQS